MRGSGPRPAGVQSTLSSPKCLILGWSELEGARKHILEVTTVTQQAGWVWTVGASRQPPLWVSNSGAQIPAFGPVRGIYPDPGAFCVSALTHNPTWPDLLVDEALPLCSGLWVNQSLWGTRVGLGVLGWTLPPPSASLPGAKCPILAATPSSPILGQLLPKPHITQTPIRLPLSVRCYPGSWEQS